jgi:undecaprenyl-diphosphatase
VDLSIYHALNDFAFHHPWFERVMHFFADQGVYLFWALLAGLWLARGRRETPSGRRGATAAGFAGLLGLGGNQVIGRVVDRARPFVHHHHHLFVPVSHDPSFPSDHATGSFAIATAIFLRHRVAGILALVLAALVSTGRVVVGTHYPSDVVAGAAIGAACAIAFWLPPLRRATDWLADRAGAVYERAARALLRQPIGPSAGVRP